jgi:hypothetical protein
VEEIAKSLEEFLETFILDTAIKSVTFDNERAKWVIEYNYDVANDEFDSAQDMINFLQSDQGGE